MGCITRQNTRDRLKQLHESGQIDIMYLQPKIKQAQTIIYDALTNSVNPVVAFSGGKDSIVVLDLVRKAQKTVHGIFCNTGNEYPETLEFVKTIDNVVWLDPLKSFWQCVKEYGLPETKSQAKRHGNHCCLYLKEKPALNYYSENNIDLVFTGLTMDESRNRMMMLKRMGPYYFHKAEKRYKCHPIYDWSEKDVWTYIKWYKLSYNPIYDLGIARCGCRFCTAYLSWKETTALYNIKDTKILLEKKGQLTLEKWNVIS